MILSVAMIVKNEEKNLDRCLNALIPLKGKLDFEIVVVDTGSTDSTIEIAKKYTNRVYEHAWNNNFAEMRNRSIKYCKGEWILILDADEVLENADELVEFLKGNEHKKCNCAVIKFINFLSDDENNYLIGGLFRLFKNIEQFCYIGRVHEQPKLIKPLGNTKISLLHYGYVRSDYELMRYKYERNLKLLLKDLEDGKDKIYTLFQLAQSYGMANEEKKAIEAIKKAYDLVEENNLYKQKLYVLHFYARQLFTMRNFKKCIDICEEAIKYSERHIDFYYMLARAYRFINKNDDAQKYIEKYFLLRKEKEKGYLEDISITDFSSCKKDEMMKEKVICLYSDKKYKEALDCYSKINDEVEKEQLKQVYLNLLFKSNELNAIKEHFKNSDITEKDIENIVDIIDSIEIEGELDTKQLVNNLLGISNVLDLYINVMYLNKKVDLDNNINLNKFYRWKANFLKKISNEELGLFENLKYVPKEELQVYISNLINNYDWMKIFYEYSESNFLTQDIEELNFIVCIEKILLFSKTISKERYSKLLQRAYLNIINYIGIIYNKEIYNCTNVNVILNKYEVMWIEFDKLVKEYKNDRIYYIKGLKAMVKEKPEFKKIIEAYTENINTEAISNEMLSERENLLKVAEQYISNGHNKEANEILIELENIFRFDADILNAKGINEYMSGDNNESILDLALAYQLKEEKFDPAYNLACVLDASDRKTTAKYYYKIAYELSNDKIIKEEIKRILINEES